MWSSVAVDEMARIRQFPGWKNVMWSLGLGEGMWVVMEMQKYKACQNRSYLGVEESLLEV